MDADSSILSPRLTLAEKSAAFAMTLLLVAINFPLQYTVLGDVQEHRFQTVVDFDFDPPRMPVMAGWPYRYAIQYHLGVGNRFSTRALVYDFLVGLAAVAASVAYVRLRNHRISLGRLGRDRVLRLVVSDLSFAFIMLIGPFVWYRSLVSAHQVDRRTYDRVQSDGGGAIMATWVPKILAAQLPQFVAEGLSRLRGLRLDNLPPDRLREALRHRTLQSLRLGGGDASISLEPLTAMPHLVDVRLAGRSLDDATLRLLGSLPQIRTVNLAKTDVTMDDLKVLADLPSLERLGLPETGLRLSDMDEPDWAHSLTDLWLPTPANGQTDQVSIANWRRLRTLRITDLDGVPNPAEMSVSLYNLPNLRELVLDAFQKFDLSLRHIPALKQVRRGEHAWRKRLSHQHPLPTGLWLRRLEMDDVPKLDELRLHAGNIQSLLIKRCSGMRRLVAGKSAYDGFGDLVTMPQAPGSARALIGGLGLSEGPREVDLRSLSFSGVELSQLCRNQGITKLNLANTETTFQQWKNLEAMSRLCELNLQDNELEAEEFDYLVANFIRLEKLLVGRSVKSADDSSDSDGKKQASDVRQPEAKQNPKSFSLDVVSRARLKSIELGDPGHTILTNVRLINLIDFESPLNLGGRTQTLRIVNAPRLQGLSVQAPVPAGAELAGVRDLKYLELGGVNVNDEIVEDLVKCDSLQQLTLPYASAGPESLAGLPVAGVRSLSVPGCRVNDSVLAAWPSTGRLLHLDLSDTDVTATAIAQRLNESPALISLWINRCDLEPGELKFLGQSRRLRSLRVAGIGLTPDVIRELLEHGSLVELDLSGSRITQEMLNDLAEHGQSLRRLRLRGCSMDRQAALALVKALPDCDFRPRWRDWLAATRIDPATFSQPMTDGSPATDPPAGQSTERPNEPTERPWRPELTHHETERTR